MSPFGSVDVLDKREFATRLLSAAQAEGRVTYIVTKSPGPLQGLRFRAIRIMKCRGVAAYAVTRREDIAHGLDLMLSYGLWHPSTLHVVVGDAAYADRLKAFCSSSDDIIPFESSIDLASTCTIEFVDDCAFFYGGTLAADGFKAVFPELEQA